MSDTPNWYERPYVTGVVAYNITADDVAACMVGDHGHLCVRVSGHITIFVDTVDGLEAIAAKLTDEVARLRAES